MRRLCIPLLPILVACLAGCSKATPELRISNMGDKVSVGPLIYTVLEAEWKSQLGEAPDVRVPKHRFLLVRLTVTNSGARQAGVPGLTIEDERGQTFTEETSGLGVPQWLGVLRRVEPAATEDGLVLFDAPPANYRLRVKEEQEETQETERSALIAVPLLLDNTLGTPAVK